MNDAPAARTPWHLWLVGTLALFWNGFGVFDFVATVTHFAPYVSQFPQGLLDYIATLPAWMWIVWFVGVFGAFAGSVLLLLRRRGTVPAFAASLLGALISAIISVVRPAPAGTGANAVLPWVIVAIAVALLAYARWLSRRGILR